jgi:hypothetical protein
LSELHKFIFEGLPVRGMLVRLTDACKTSWRAALPTPKQVLTLHPCVSSWVKWRRPVC